MLNCYMNFKSPTVRGVRGRLVSHTKAITSNGVVDNHIAFRQIVVRVTSLLSLSLSLCSRR